MMKRSFLLPLLLFAFGCTNSQAQYRTINVDQAELLLKDTSTALLDVRTPEEYSETHIQGAKLIPVQELEQRMSELTPWKGKQLVVYCRSGSRSKRASDMLSKAGYEVSNVDGGISAWQSAGKPVVHQTP